MEEIKWITTPRCSECVPDRSFARRHSCMGCEKLRPAREKTKIRRPNKTSRFNRQERDSRILTLRSRSCSLGEIALKLKLPRSTVASVVSRNAPGRDSGSIFKNLNISHWSSIDE